MLVGSGVLLLTAAGLYLAGQPTVALVFGGLIVLNTIVALVVGR